MASSRTHYEILGIPEDATPEEIRRAYRERSLRSHPDVNRKVGARTEFLKIQEAYEVLSDHSKRLEYDQQQESHSRDPLKLEVLYSRSKIQPLGEPQLLYAHLRFSPQAAFIAKSNPTLNLCLVLDRSTSMTGKRLDTVKSAAIELIRQIQSGDVVSLVTFSDRAEVLLAAARSLDLAQSESQIRLIKAGGGTELFQGLEAGYQEIRRSINRSQVNHIFLITDGHTYGDEKPCLDLADACASEGICITALGIGTEWNDEFLDRLTHKTGGSTFFISNPSDLQRMVQEKFSSLVQIFAERVTLKLDPASGVKVRSAFRLQPDAAMLSFENPIYLGSIQKNSDLRLFLELSVEGVDPKAPRRPLADGELSLVLPSSPLADHTFEFRLSRLVGDPEPDEAPPPEIIHALTRITLYRMQERARREAAEGRVEDAGKRLRRLAMQLRSIGETALSQTALLEVDRIRETRHISAEGEKTLKYSTRALLLPSPLKKGNPT